MHSCFVSVPNVEMSGNSVCYDQTQAWRVDAEWLRRWQAGAQRRNSFPDNVPDKGERNRDWIVSASKWGRGMRDEERGASTVNLESFGRGCVFLAGGAGARLKKFWGHCSWG